MRARRREARRLFLPSAIPRHRLLRASPARSGSPRCASAWPRMPIAWNAVSPTRRRCRKNLSSIWCWPMCRAAAREHWGAIPRFGTGCAWKTCPARPSRQRAILSAALRAVRRGGCVVYSTCSLEPEENEQVVAAVLAENGNARQVSFAPVVEALLGKGILEADGAERLQKCLTPEGALAPIARRVSGRRLFCGADREDYFAENRRMRSALHCHGQCHLRALVHA